MLQNTFCHVPRIGLSTERNLWSAGVHSWTAARDGVVPLSAAKTELLKRHVATSCEQLEQGNSLFFARQLPSDQDWRMFREFQDSVAYLDIETTGLGGHGDHITTVALYDGRAIRYYIHGQNLEEFGDDIASYRLLVTFNGRCFDLPFIRNTLGLPMRQAHIDLRYVLRGLGYRGGLKRCERQLGLDRGELADVDGYTAVLLWQEFQRRHNERALQTLLAYNILDTINLAHLMALSYNLKLADTPFAATHQVPIPLAPEIPFQPDLEVLARVRRHNGQPGTTIACD
jgi:uncharacterized protein